MWKACTLLSFKSRQAGTVFTQTVLSQITCIIYCSSSTISQCDMFFLKLLLKERRLRPNLKHVKTLDK